MWYEWESSEAFNSWHNELCAELGFPAYGINQATGEINYNSQPTTNYTEAYEVSGKWIAWVDDLYKEGLILTDLRLPLEPLER